MTATIGTIPALPQYQPGALTISGQEILEIASSANATSAASYFIYLTDLVGKAPSVMTTAGPSANDMIAFYQESTRLPVACQLGQIGSVFGNLPIGGVDSQILIKNGSTNYSSSWGNLSSLVSASTSLFLTGSTSIALGVATGGIGGPQIATNAVGNVQLRQGSPLSIIGNAANATANVADIAATGGLQVLQSNAAGTGLVFAVIGTGILPGPFQTSTLTKFGVVYGNGTSALGATAPGTTGLVLLGNGSAVAPSFQQINLATTLSITGVLPLGNGGWGTTTLTSFGIVYGAGTSTPGITASGGTGLPLVATGGVPGFSILSLAGGGLNTTTLTQFGVVFGNGTSTVGITASGGTGLPLVANGAAPSFAVLAPVGGGLGTTTLTVNGVVIGNGTSTVKVSAQPGTGTLFVGTGTGNAPSFTTAPILGGVGVTSFLQMAGQTSGVVILQVQQAAGTWNFNLPITQGTTTPPQAFMASNATTPSTWTSILTMNGTSQTFSGGVVLTPFNLGSANSGTTTLNPGNAPIQRIINNATTGFVIQAPAVDGEMDLLVTNAATAGSITFVGFNVPGNTGDSYTTTNTQKFILVVRTINALSTYRWAALQ